MVLCVSVCESVLVWIIYSMVARIWWNVNRSPKRASPKQLSQAKAATHSIAQYRATVNTGKQTGTQILMRMLRLVTAIALFLASDINTHAHTHSISFHHTHLYTLYHSRCVLLLFFNTSPFSSFYTKLRLLRIDFIWHFSLDAHSHPTERFIRSRQIYSIITQCHMCTDISYSLIPTN